MGRLLQALHKLPLVLRLARRRSGHGNDVVGAVRANQRSELFADGHGAVDGLGLQDLVVEFALTQAHRLFELDEYVGGMVRIDANEQQANRVGADVHEGDVARFRRRRGIVHEGSRKVMGERAEITRYARATCIVYAPSALAALASRGCGAIKAATTEGARGSLPRRAIDR